jgi:hypothetical protein
VYVLRAPHNVEFQINAREYTLESSLTSLPIRVSRIASDRWVGSVPCFRFLMLCNKR